MSVTQTKPGRLLGTGAVTGDSRLSLLMRHCLQILQKLGIRAAFGQADFSTASADPLVLTNVLHSVSPTRSNGTGRHLDGWPHTVGVPHDCRRGTC